MKILIVSLLRLGDILLHLPVIAKLKVIDPEAEVHLLINDAFINLEPMLKGIDKVHYFPRKLLQTQMNDPQSHLLNPVYLLKNKIKELNDENFDRAINLTQNRLSGLIMELLEAKDKEGTVYKNNSFQIVKSPWYKYLNETISDKECLFHFADVACQGDASTYSSSQVGLKATRLGEEEYAELKLNLSNTICYQFFTSDLKKNISVDNALKIIQKMQEKFPTHEHIVLLAPQEKFPKISSIKQFVCSLEGAYSALMRAQLLITVDTSIKHMAYYSDTPLIELALGSSVISFTSSISEGAYIVQAESECFPCAHSHACHQPNHICESIFARTDVISEISEAILNQREVKLTKSSGVHQVVKSPYGSISLKSFTSSNQYKEAIGEIEKFITFIYLKSQSEKNFKYQSHQLILISDHILNLFQNIKMNVLIGYFASLHAESKMIDEKLREFEYQLITHNQICDELLLEASDHYNYLKSIKAQLQTKVGTEYVRMRKIQKLILESKSKLNFRIQLYSDLIKWGGEYESRTRSLPGGRAQEA